MSEKLCLSSTLPSALKEELQMIPNWEEHSLHWNTDLLAIKTLNSFVSFKNRINEIEEGGNHVEVEELG